MVFLIIVNACHAQRSIQDFNKGWKFFLGNDSLASEIKYDDSKWRLLDLPHDWSIEGSFSEKHPTTFNQAALPAGVGWYRKSFTVPASSANKIVYVNFDGIYRNSEVWVNGNYLGKRPNGYVSFRYEMTPYLFFDGRKNIIAVKVDNSAQPNSRWYTGSGIYRKVWLLTTNKIAVDQWGIFVMTPVVTNKSALVFIKTDKANFSGKSERVGLSHEIYDANGKLVAASSMVKNFLRADTSVRADVSSIKINNPRLWSVDRPYLYKLVTKVLKDGKAIDRCETLFGIRSFYFDAAKGFFLNGKPLKILGVCNHHDLGALGVAVNKRAIERQLEILKAMGCNAIRTAHNPPASELLDLCDKMGFIVMDEAFDMWHKRKNKFDYSVDFDQWHKRDLEDQVKRDRNHPSVFIWSIGNEIREQFDSSGISIAKELVAIVKSVDATRPVTSALTENIPEKNFIYQSGALDLLGFNYKLNAYPELPKRFPGAKLIASETNSALASRGHYDMPSDSMRVWPPDAKPFTNGNPDLTVSSYDHVFAYWGASHEESWKAIKQHEFISGIFVWSGFDFLGEPVPYQWPARSSYYGIIDLAGFPKDVYYMYQTEWTRQPVLHIFPHWNWTPGQLIDVWAYYNQADEVELFLNGKSQGIRKKRGGSLHVMWRLRFEPGTLKAVSRLNGRDVLTKQIRTAGVPAKIELLADRKTISTAADELSFITIKILDADGNIVPYADNLLEFEIKGPGSIAGVDNGNPASMESFKTSVRKAYNGLALLIIRANQKGELVIRANSEGLRSSTIRIKAN